MLVILPGFLSINHSSLFYTLISSFHSSIYFTNSSFHSSFIILLDRLLGASLYNDDFIAIRLKTKRTNERDFEECPIIYSYLFDISQYILLPIYSFIRLFVYSFDVIHTLGFYSWGIKIDAIPGRINLGTTLRLLWKGEYRGKCFELCGQGHLSMLLLSTVL